jgi:hypothetical protein
LLKTLDFKPTSFKMLKGYKGDSDPVDNLVQHTQNDTIHEPAGGLNSIDSEPLPEIN